jgi:hypothetical protein
MVPAAVKRVEGAGECRAISLTRDVPQGLGWIIEPIIDKLPRESLVATLEATRKALSSDVAAAVHQHGLLT